MGILFLYLLLVVVPNIHDFANGPIWVTVLIPLAGAMLFLGFSIVERATAKDYADEKDRIESADKLREICVSIIKKSFIGVAILTMLNVFTASNKQLYGFAGAYAATNSLKASKLPENILKAANDWLEKVRKEETKEKKPSEN